MNKSISLPLDDVVPPAELLLSLDLADLAYLSEFVFKNSNRHFPEEHGSLVAFLYGNDNQKCSADAQGYVFFKKQTNTVYVAFRGSSHMQDFWNDSNKLVTMGGQHGKACVHEGFLHQYKSLQKELLTLLLNKLKFDSIVFCGHSLGGAIAAVAAAFYISTPQRHSKQVKIHTFGAPRIGNKAFSEYFDKVQNVEYWRVNCDADPIPNLPHSPKFCHVFNCNVLNLTANSSSTTKSDNLMNEAAGVTFANSIQHSLNDCYSPRLQRVLQINRPGAQQTCQLNCIIM